MIDRVVLDVQLSNTKPFGESIGADERREARMQTGLRLAFDREELPISPQVPRPGFNRLAIHEAGDGAVVPRDFERAQALVAHPECGGREGGVAKVAAECEVHIV